MKAENTVVIPPTSDNIDQAVTILKAGGVVAIPTETVYGLAANAMDASAIGRIYEAKGRPANNPLIVHVASIADAQALTTEWPDEARALAEAFWPGPLTIVLKKRHGVVPAITTAGGDTVAVRCPDHPVALELLRRCGFPLAAPSANRSNHISPTLAEHVVRSLGGRIPLVLDGGACRAGIESTVVNLTSKNVEILRPGSISMEDLARVLSAAQSAQSDIKKETTQAAPEQGQTATRSDTFLSPGQQQTHYAPDTPLLLSTAEGLQSLVEGLASKGKRAGVMVLTEPRFQAPDIITVVPMPRDPVKYGEKLYAILHQLDQAGLDQIVCEMPPQNSAWAAVNDRLGRAGTLASL